jgi:hypothetical protein
MIIFCAGKFNHPHPAYQVTLAGCPLLGKEGKFRARLFNLNSNELCYYELSPPCRSSYRQRRSGSIFDGDEVVSKSRTLRELRKLPMG